jgi:hypothetical protein
MPGPDQYLLRVWPLLQGENFRQEYTHWKANFKYTKLLFSIRTQNCASWNHWGNMRRWSQLAKGYLNRPELTEKIYSACIQGERLYKTGDTGKWLADEIVDTGRMTIRSKKFQDIESNSKIEQALLARPQINEAVVVVKKGKTNLILKKQAISFQ